MSVSDWIIGEVPKINQDYLVSYEFWHWLTKSNPVVGPQFKFKYARVLIEIIAVDELFQRATARASYMYG